MRDERQTPGRDPLRVALDGLAAALNDLNRAGRSAIRAALANVDAADAAAMADALAAIRSALSAAQHAIDRAERADGAVQSALQSAAGRDYPRPAARCRVIRRKAWGLSADVDAAIDDALSALDDSRVRDALAGLVCLAASETEDAADARAALSALAPDIRAALSAPDPPRALSAALGLDDPEGDA